MLAPMLVLVSRNGCLYLVVMLVHVCYVLIFGMSSYVALRPGSSLWFCYVYVL